LSESCPLLSAEDAPLATRYLQTVRSNKYIPHEPTEKQALFLLHDHIPEILYGGSAGGGKSDALLMAALQYCPRSRILPPSSCAEHTQTSPFPVPSWTGQRNG